MDSADGTCWICDKNSDRKCSKCNLSRYCSSECQKKDRIRHFEECIGATQRHSPCFCCGKEITSRTYSCDICCAVHYCTNECKRKFEGVHSEICNKVQEKILEISSTIKGWNRRGKNSPHYFGRLVHAFDFLKWSENERGSNIDSPTNPLSVLMFGADLKHLLLTLSRLPEGFDRELEFTCVDSSPQLIGRNILILYLLRKSFERSSDVRRSVGQVLFIYYSLRLDGATFVLLQRTLDTLRAFTWSRFNQETQHTITLNLETFHGIQRVWNMWLEFSYDPEALMKMEEVRSRKVSTPEVQKTMDGVRRVIPEEFEDGFSYWVNCGSFFLDENLDTYPNVTLSSPDPSIDDPIGELYTESSGDEKTKTSITEWDDILYSPFGSDLIFQDWDFDDVAREKGERGGDLLILYEGFVGSVLYRAGETMTFGDIKWKFIITETIDSKAEDILPPEAKGLYDRICTGLYADIIGLPKLLKLLSPHLNRLNPFSLLFTHHRLWSTFVQGKYITMLKKEWVNNHSLEKPISPSTAMATKWAAFRQFLQAEAICYTSKLNDDVPLDFVAPPKFSEISDMEGLLMNDFLSNLNRIFPFRFRVDKRYVTMPDNKLYTLEWRARDVEPSLHSPITEFLQNEISDKNTEIGNDGSLIMRPGLHKHSDEVISMTENATSSPLRSFVKAAKNKYDRSELDSAYASRFRRRSFEAEDFETKTIPKESIFQMTSSLDRSTTSTKWADSHRRSLTYGSRSKNENKWKRTEETQNSVKDLISLFSKDQRTTRNVKPIQHEDSQKVNQRKYMRSKNTMDKDFDQLDKFKFQRNDKKQTTNVEKMEDSLDHKCREITMRYSEKHAEQTHSNQHYGACRTKPKDYVMKDVAGLVDTDAKSTYDNQGYQQKLGKPIPKLVETNREDHQLFKISSKVKNIISTFEASRKPHEQPDCFSKHKYPENRQEEPYKYYQKSQFKDSSYDNFISEDIPPPKCKRSRISENANQRLEISKAKAKSRLGANLKRLSEIYRQSDNFQENRGPIFSDKNEDANVVRTNKQDSEASYICPRDEIDFCSMEKNHSRKFMNQNSEFKEPLNFSNSGKRSIDNDKEETSERRLQEKNEMKNERKWCISKIGQLIHQEENEIDQDQHKCKTVTQMKSILKSKCQSTTPRKRVNDIASIYETRIEDLGYSGRLKSKEISNNDSERSYQTYRPKIQESYVTKEFGASFDQMLVEAENQYKSLQENKDKKIGSNISEPKSKFKEIIRSFTPKSKGEYTIQETTKGKNKDDIISNRYIQKLCNEETIVIEEQIESNLINKHDGVNKSRKEKDFNEITSVEPLRLSEPDTHIQPLSAQELTAGISAYEVQRPWDSQVSDLQEPKDTKIFTSHITWKPKNEPDKVPANNMTVSMRKKLSFKNLLSGLDKDSESSIEKSGFVSSIEANPIIKETDETYEQGCTFSSKMDPHTDGSQYDTENDSGIEFSEFGVEEAVDVVSLMAHEGSKEANNQHQSTFEEEKQIVQEKFTRENEDNCKVRPSIMNSDKTDTESSVTHEESSQNKNTLSYIKSILAARSALSSDDTNKPSYNLLNKTYNLFSLEKKQGKESFSSPSEEEEQKTDKTDNTSIEMRPASHRSKTCPKGYGCQPGGTVSALVGVYDRSEITNQSTDDSSALKVFPSVLKREGPRKSPKKRLRVSWGDMPEYAEYCTIFEDDSQKDEDEEEGEDEDEEEDRENSSDQEDPYIPPEEEKNTTKIFAFRTTSL